MTKRADIVAWTIFITAIVLYAIFIAPYMPIDK